MALFQFLGIHASNATLSDGSVIAVEPGDIVDLGALTPGPLWQAAAAGSSAERGDLPDAQPLNS